MKRHFNRANMIAALLIVAPAVNALLDYLDGGDLRSAIRSAIAGSFAATCAYFMTPPSKRAAPAIALPAEKAGDR